MLVLAVLAGALHGAVTGASLWYLLCQPVRQVSSAEMVWLNWKGAESVGIIVGITLAAGLLGGGLGSIPSVVAWLKTLAEFQIVLTIAIVGAVIMLVAASKDLGVVTAALTGFILFGGTSLLVYAIIWLIKFMMLLPAWQNILIISALTAISLAVFGKGDTFWGRAWTGFLSMLMLSAIGYGLYQGIIYLGGLLGLANTAFISWLNSVLGTNWQTSTSAVATGQPSYTLGITLGFIMAGGGLVYLVSKGFSGLGLDENDNPKAWAVIISLPLLILTGLFTNIAFTREISLNAGFKDFGFIGLALGAFFSIAYVLKEDYAGDLYVEKSRASWLRFIMLIIIFLAVCGTLGYAIIDYAGNFSYVSANMDWQSSSVYVQDGDLVFLAHVNGMWSADPQNSNLPYVSAQGYSDSSAIDESWKQYPSFALGQLVAKTSSMTQAYSVGLINIIRFNTNGSLYLRMNDANLADNAGKIQVMVVNLTGCLR
jgi:hypothetical protein